MSERDLNCVISGSIRKFKPEIDLAIDEFTDLGVMVLAPEKGWLFKPPTRLLTLEDREFRPLPSEVNMSVRQIEDSFLHALRRSDFVYIINPGGYVGTSVTLEMGYAMGMGVPIYSKYPIDPNLDLDLSWRERIKEVKVMSPEDVVKDFTSSL